MPFTMNDLVKSRIGDMVMGLCEADLLLQDKDRQIHELKAEVHRLSSITENAGYPDNGSQVSPPATDFEYDTGRPFHNGA